MQINMWFSLLLFSIWTVVCHGQTVVTAPYQVSIRSNVPAIAGFGPSSNNINNSGVSSSSEHICSGVVIRDKYILTTAGCLIIQDTLTKLSRLVIASEIFIIAGNLSLNPHVYGDEASGSIRRNVVSVIPHGRFNLTSGENDIALLKLDRSLPLYNTTSVRWIELQRSPQQQIPAAISPPGAPVGSHPNSQQTAATLPVAVSANNKVNENCFINIYNNSVGGSSYPYTVVRNVSFFEKWICDAQRKVPIERNGSCIEYRFSNSQSCLLDANTLKQSAERGTALVCNSKLAAILAEINPPSNPQSCISIKRTTAYYTMVEPYYDWIVTEIGYLYSTATATATAGTPAAGATGTLSGGSPVAGTQLNPNVPPGASWNDQPPIGAATTNPGKSKSTAAPSISSGIVFKLILFNLFIPFAFIYRFHH